MTQHRQWIFGWLIPGVAAVAVAVVLLAWQWPRIAGQSASDPAPIELGASRPANTVSTADHVRISAERRNHRLVTTLIIDEHWHVNANPASLDFLIPTALTAAANGEALPLTVTYPQGHTIDVGLDKPIAVYDGGVEIMAELPDVANTAPIEVVVRAQACNDSGRCLVPSTLRTLALQSPPDNGTSQSSR